MTRPHHANTHARPRRFRRHRETGRTPRPHHPARHLTALVTGLAVATTMLGGTTPSAHGDPAPEEPPTRGVPPSTQPVLTTAQPDLDAPKADARFAPDAQAGLDAAAERPAPSLADRLGTTPAPFAAEGRPGEKPPLPARRTGPATPFTPDGRPAPPGAQTGPGAASTADGHPVPPLPLLTGAQPGLGPAPVLGAPDSRPAPLAGIPPNGTPIVREDAVRPLGIVGKLPDSLRIGQRLATGLLRANGIRWRSSGGCSNPKNRTCTSFQNVRLGTIRGLIGFAAASGCAITVTGGTERGHASGSVSHGSGHKLDIAPTRCVDRAIRRYRTAGVRGDGARLYRSPNGTLFAREKDHWDITFR